MTTTENQLGSTAHRDPPRSVRPLLLRLHFYAGVLVGPFIVVAAVTGALYALAPTIERAVYHDITTVQRGEQTQSLHGQAAAAQASVPDLAIAGMRPASGPTDSTRVYFADPALPADTQRAVFVDPYTNQVLGAQDVWFGYLPLSTWLDAFHRNLQLGEPGRVYSELAASWLWVVALGGLYLWLAKRRRDRVRGKPARLLRPDRSTKGRARTLNWHGTTGIWILLVLLFLSATGITWSLYAGAHVTDLRAQFGWQRPELSTHQHSMGTPTATPASVDFDGVAKAAAEAGIRGPFDIALPAEPGQAISVTEADREYRLGNNAVALDPATLQPTSSVEYWRDYSLVAKLADWGVRAHMGLLFGPANQLLLLAVAVALVTVIVRGYRMWWQRRPTRGSSWALGRAPLRGGIRRLPVAAVGGVAVVAVAVGWFLPLLGLSLLAFLVVDAALGLWKARTQTPS